MAKDPKFVRLPERLISGSVADVMGPSEFFIGGRDVQPFPPDSDPDAQRFVRNCLRNNMLEEATGAEHDVVQKAAKELSEDHSEDLEYRELHDRYGHQEQRVQAAAKRTTRELDRLRANDSSDDDEEPQDAPVHPTGRRKAPAQQ